MPRLSKLLILTITALFVVALFLGTGCDSLKWRLTAPGQNERLAPEFELIEQTWRIIYQDYVDKGALDPKKLSKGAIEGMLKALDDPYTAYLDANLFRELQEHLQGTYEGIGAAIGIKDDHIVITASFPKSPAEKAGIRAGDQILEIDGKSTSGMSPTEAVLRIKGPKETKVTLTVLHQGEPSPTTIEIVRQEIEVPSVSYNILPGDVAHLKIFQFTERTPAEMRTALEDIKSRGARAIVLDLRNNPGGLLESAVEVASHFLKEGAVVYEGTIARDLREWKVRPSGLATEIPMAVLVNGFSASGSEVVAGALRDHGRAIIIGTKTFGKGSVNIYRTLEDGSAVYITYARWFTPDRQLIEGKGIVPDRVVDITSEDKEQGLDPQLDEALKYLSSVVSPSRVACLV